MKTLRTVLFLFSLVSATACSVPQKIADQEAVYARTRIHFTHPESIAQKSKLESDLLGLSQPKPASGIRKFQTWVYNATSRSKRVKGLTDWIRRKVGKPPVLFNQGKVDRTRLVLQKYMHDNGFFGARVSLDTLQKGRKVSVTYTVRTFGQYVIRKIELPVEPPDLALLVKENAAKSWLQPGTAYQQTALSNERKRLAEAGNNSGYMNVSPDHFYYFVDTTAGDHQVDIFLKIRQAQDPSIFQKYYLNQVVVHADYSLSGKELKQDTTQIDNFILIRKSEIVRPDILQKMVGGNPGELYVRKQQNAALARLINLGIYKFVNVKLEQHNIDSSYSYNRYVFLTPSLMQDIAAEFQFNTRSGNYLGLGGSLTYTHKNIWKGAERLDIKINGGLETQIGNTQNFINTANIGFQNELSIPNIILPQKFKGSENEFIPRTRLNIGNNFQRRTGFFSMNTINFKFGYEWNKVINRLHRLYPINVNQISVFQKSQVFEDSLARNLRLAQSFEDVFILGLKYDYNYNTIRTNEFEPYSFLSLGLETSGNIPDLFSTLTANQGGSPYTILGVPFSQFVWADLDFRHFIPLKKSVFATRFYGGMGIPYRNSKVLPFAKQFFSGGAGSVRAYRIRALGPGGFHAPDLSASNDFFDQTGDIKLEMNLEYRFPIISYLRGAVFLDAGNIWLLNNENDTRPEGVFHLNRFYKEIAVGTGAGLRLDLEYLVLRFDGSFALRRNFAVNDQYWTFPEIDFSKKSWRKENLVWHLAIGYPF